MIFSTLTSQAYVPGTLALLQSFKENSGIKGARWTVLAEDDLTDASIEALERAGARLISRKDIGTFAFDPSKMKHERFVGAMQKLTVFLLETKGEAVCFIDSDVLVLRDISALLQCQPFTSVGIIGRGLAEPIKGRPPFSGGLMILKPSRKIFEAIQRHALQMRDTRMGDQYILASYLYSTDPESVHLLDVEYQMIDECWAHNPGMFVSRAPRMIHFCAHKPWHGPDALYQPLVDLWNEYYRRAL